MHDVLTFMKLLKEALFIFDINLPKPEVFSKVFEDNHSWIVVSQSNKFSPRTKKIGIKYNHFIIFIKKRLIRMCYIDTTEQTAEIFTKPLNDSLLIYLQRKIDGL